MLKSHFIEPSLLHSVSNVIKSTSDNTFPVIMDINRLRDFSQETFNISHNMDQLLSEKHSKRARKSFQGPYVECFFLYFKEFLDHSSPCSPHLPASIILAYKTTYTSTPVTGSRFLTTLPLLRTGRRLALFKEMATTRSIFSCVRQ